LPGRHIELHRWAHSTTDGSKFVPVSYRGFVISSGFAWVEVSLPTTAHAKRGGTIPMTVPSVCTVVVHVVKRSPWNTWHFCCQAMWELLWVGAGLLAKAVYQKHHCWMCRHLREQARSHIGQSPDIRFSLV